MISRIFTAVFIMAIISSGVFAQMHGKLKAIQKMEELKKIKLIEILQLDEETSVRFFTKRSEHMRRMEELNEAGKLKIDQIEDLIKDQKEIDNPALKKSIDEYLQFQGDLVNEKQNFFNSVREILSPVQMAKFVVFEERFRNEVSDLILRGRNRRMRDK